MNKKLTGSSEHILYLVLRTVLTLLPETTATTCWMSNRLSLPSLQISDAHAYYLLLTGTIPH